MGEITAEWDTRIAPSGYAFSIWGLIYSLLGCFAVYQAIPSGWIPDRNDTMIFSDIGYVFFINLGLITPVWLVLFQTNTWWGMLLALFDIIGMLSTNLYIMMVACRNTVNIFELIFLRGGFSIYSGWVTAATILNFTFLLQQFGVGEPDIPFFDEE